MTVRTLLVLLTATLPSEGFARAQASAGNDLTTVVYPVADLVHPISANRTAEKITTSENELMAHLRKKVAPATWEQAGGQGSIRYERKGYVLHVRQTAKVHAELKSFLDQLLREQVSVETRIVSISEKGLEELERSGNVWSRIQWTKKDGVVSTSLDELQLFRFLEFVQGDRAAHIMQLPKITMFDGQDATLSGGMWHEVLGVDFQEKDGKPAMITKKELVYLGPKARFLPTISKDQRLVTLQVEISCKSRANEEVKTPNQQPSFDEFKLAVVAKVPDRRTVAILAGTTTAEVRTETASPLSRIPYVSRLVRNVGYSRESMKLIVLLTPRIVREEEIAEVQPLRTKMQAEDNGKFPLILPQGGK
jgi:type II secretory pathway component GspD/PulD (secretin)